MGKKADYVTRRELDVFLSAEGFLKKKRHTLPKSHFGVLYGADERVQKIMFNFFKRCGTSV